MQFWEDVILPVLEQIWQNIIEIMPNILAAIVILVIGWVIAKLISVIVSRLLQRIGFNRMAERAGLSGFLKNAGFTREPSWVVGKLIFWLLMLTFILPAADQLQLTAISLTLQKLVGFIPNVIAVVLILVFGMLFARFISGIVRGSAKDAGIDFSDFLAKAVNNVIVIIVAVLAFSQLNIQSSIVEITFAAIVGAFCLAVALTLGLGSRRIAYNILSGVYARKSFHIGQQVNVRNMDGEIVEIGTVSTVIKNKEVLVTLPNSLLVDEIASSKNGTLKPATEESEVN